MGNFWNDTSINNSNNDDNKINNNNNDNVKLPESTEKQLDI